MDSKTPQTQNKCTIFALAHFGDILKLIAAAKQI
jgi:hypothetical protein